MANYLSISEKSLLQKNYKTDEPKIVISTTKVERFI